VRKTFAKRPLRQRVIALVAAHAIALAGLIAAFGAAQAAAEALNQPGGIICHSIAEQPAPASDQSDGKTCVDCCVGCVTTAGVALQPTAPAVTVPQISGKRPGPLARSASISTVATNAHRSRGPPPVL
jgi:DUF2946 family protein